MADGWVWWRYQDVTGFEVSFWVLFDREGWGVYTVAVQAEGDDGEDQLGDAEGEGKVEHCGGLVYRGSLEWWLVVCGAGMWGMQREACILLCLAG